MTGVIGSAAADGRHERSAAALRGRDQSFAGARALPAGRGPHHEHRAHGVIQEPAAPATRGKVRTGHVEQDCPSNA